MRSRRNMVVLLVVAVVCVLGTPLVATGWPQLVLGAASVLFGGLFLVALTMRRQDPNGPPGQH